MSIRQDPRNRRWYFRFYRGKSYFKSGFRTRDQAKEAEVKCLSSVLDNGARTERPAQQLTLAEAGRLFFENHSKRNKRSWKNDRARVGLIGNFFKKTLMRDVTPEMLEEFLDGLQRKF